MLGTVRVVIEGKLGLPELSVLVVLLQQVLQHQVTCVYMVISLFA